MDTTPKAKSRDLLATWTNEPFQPVRLYYAIPEPAFVTDKLAGLDCMVEAPEERCWQWLFHGEAVKIKLDAGYEDVPVEKRPIVLGRIRFPKRDAMTLETNSIQRAIEGARFFGPRFGPKVVAMRVRVVNRCFAAEEGRLDELMKTLDRDVTVIDPRDAELAFMRNFNGVRTIQDFNRAAGEHLARTLQNKDDAPLVEDFPLAPEEETPEFQHLTTTLRLRLLRAFEHWKGNTHMTLAAIIMRAVERHMRAQDGNGSGGELSRILEQHGIP